MNIVIVGYSGHGYTAIDNFISNGHMVIGYVDSEEKKNNPYGLDYFGSENSDKAIEAISKNNYFVSIGDATIRERITNSIFEITKIKPVNCIHKNVVLNSHINFGYGIYLGAGTIVNSNARIENGVICNTGSIIDHEVILSDYSFVGPGSTLCGNVKVGSKSFIGANSTIIPGIIIGDNVTVGAGSVVIRNLDSNCKVAGNPAKGI